MGRAGSPVAPAGDGPATVQGGVRGRPWTPTRPQTGAQRPWWRRIFGVEKGEKVYEDDPPDLHEAIRQYIWQKEQRPYHFGKRDMEALAESTDEPYETVEVTFFSLAGDVWAGTIMLHGHGRPDVHAYRSIPPPLEWLGVAFDRRWMWDRGTLPKSRH